jgi:hypothetical protein
LVVVSRKGYEDVQQKVTIEAGRTASVPVQHSGPAGEIEIITIPPGVEVLIDGRSIGPSPVRATLAPGQHTYVLSQPGMEAYRGSLTTENGTTKIIRVNLGGEVTPTGIVEVHTIPAGATVTADGNRVQAQTPTAFLLTAGRHTLVISLSGFNPVQRVIEVKTGEPVEVDVVMRRQ